MLHFNYYRFSELHLKKKLFLKINNYIFNQTLNLKYIF